jgi:hypothetical protein
MFATIHLPSSPTPLDTLFGITEGTVRQFRFSFSEDNSESATIVKAAGLTAGVVDTPAAPGSSSMMYLNAAMHEISISGNTTDNITLEYEPR